MKRDISTALSTVIRYAAFTEEPAGGNPAGVVLDASGLSDADQLAIARDVGYSETAFLTPRDPASRGEYDVRYFSSVAEVAFCGHATIAAAVAVAERAGPGTLEFHTREGRVLVATRRTERQRLVASLISVTPSVDEVEPADLAEALAALRWNPDELDDSLPPRIAFAGVRHLVVAAGSRDRLARLDYDFDALKVFMLRCNLTTVDLVFDAGDNTYDARNPFPVGGVYEDPATGAAAAAFGAFLRHLERVNPPAQITIHQGDDMGRPSRLIVDIPAGSEGITVSGSAVPIPE